LDFARLPGLLTLGDGAPDIAVAIIDGPVAIGHPDLSSARIRSVPGGAPLACGRTGSPACRHGTFVAGILAANHGSQAPGICRLCTFLLRPLFAEGDGRNVMPTATPEELARAIGDCVNAGASIVNISAATSEPSTRAESALDESLRYAGARGVIVVAAAGNQGTLGTSAITRHRWVIPVVGCSLRGAPMPQSNLGGSIGRRGVGAPGEAITSLAAEGGHQKMSGTSFAAAFVTGIIALLWSRFPEMSAQQMKEAVLSGGSPRRRAVVPPLLDVRRAYETLAKRNGEPELAA
jgi:subtilisin family serine protease